MVWERFHYICRRCHKTIKTEQTIEECMANIEMEPTTDLYGKLYKSESIANSLLKLIKSIADQSIATNIVDLYGKLDLSTPLNEPIQFKRVMIYLFFVTTIFSLVVVTYQLFVFPSFLAAFDSFETSIPKHLIFLSDYWVYFQLIIFFLLIMGLVIGFGLRRLYRYNISTNSSFVFKYLTLAGIKKSYLNILETIYYPVSSHVNNYGIQHSIITEHLQNMESSGMDIKREIQDIIKRESLILSLLCERQMRIVSTLIAIIVIATIFFFLTSAYSPIFMLGETI